MTRLELRNYVLYWLDDLEGGYFTPVQVNAWLNRSLREVQKQLIQAGEMWYLRCATVTTAINRREYQLPQDFLKSHRLQYTLEGSGVNEVVQVIKPASLNSQDFYGKGAGTPEIFVLRQNSFQLFPAPDQATTLELEYSYRIADMEDDGDTPDVPDQYQEYVAILAAFNGYIKDDRVPSQLEAKRQYYVDMMKKDSEERQEDFPRHVIITQTDDVYGDFLF